MPMIFTDVLKSRGTWNTARARYQKNTRVFVRRGNEKSLLLAK